MNPSGKNIGIEGGAALVTALLFLIVITLLGITSMRSSVMELRLSGNEQKRMEAAEIGQSFIDAIMKDPGNFIAGSSNCTTGVPGCDYNEITLPTVSGDTADNFSYSSARIDDLACAPLPRGAGFTVRSSSGGGGGGGSGQLQGASFNIQSTYDQASEGRGRATIVQGYLKVAEC